MLVAIVTAIAAGASFATAGVLQQHAASQRPEGEALSFRLLVDLARDGMWWLGIGFAFLSYVLESVALAYGPLVLVQPLIVTELLFALPISISWRGMRMSGREWFGTGLVTAGLALGLASAAPGQGRPAAPAGEWAVGLAGVAVAAVIALSIGRRAAGPLRSSLYALAAAVVLGAQAALLKATVIEFEHGILTALTDWYLWGMVAASILGLLLVQSAYESGPLATSMPVVDAVDPTVGILFGIALFHETVRTGWWLAGIFGGAALLLAGIVLLDTSPLIHSLQQLEVAQRSDDDASTDPPTAVGHPGGPTAGRPGGPFAGPRGAPPSGHPGGHPGRRPDG